MPAPKGNQYYKLRETIGRKPFYDSVESLTDRAVEYFESLEKNQKATVTGLAYFLGFQDRSSFYEYEKKQGFTHVIKRLRLLVESGYETLVADGKTSVIFLLKNMGWDDQSILNVNRKYEDWTEEELEAERNRLARIRGAD